MRYVIEDKVCKDKQLSIAPVLAMLLVRTGVNIKELFEYLLQEEMIVKDVIEGRYLITYRWNNVCTDILLDSEKYKEKNADSNLKELAKELMAVFPPGKIPGTPYYYKCNVSEVVRHLKMFFKRHGNTWSNEQILEAARKYIASFNGSYTGRSLKYFIIKDDKKIDEFGKGYIAEISDLLTFLENEDVVEYSDNSKMA